MKVLFVAGFAPIAPDPAASRRLYQDALGLPLEIVGGGPDGPDAYVATERLDGVKHFGIWPLSAAAEACFGTSAWPADIPVPSGSLEFDVDDVDAAAAELEAAGYRLLVRPKTEDWGQKVARLLSPEGLLVGITETPWLREHGSLD